MDRIEIGSIVRVRSDYFNTNLQGKFGNVVAYHKFGDAEVLVSFEHVNEGRLHSGNDLADRPLNGRSNRWWLNPKYLEVIKQEEKEDKSMTKKDLKSGMTVKTRGGNIYLVVNEGLSRQFGFEPLSYYRDNLTHTGDKSFDIVEVYLFSTPSYGNVATLEVFLDLDNPMMKLLWKRQDLPKLSSAERVILESLDKTWTWIARDKDGALWLYDKKPLKRTQAWYNTRNAESLLVFPASFTFVKWENEQPYNIAELLKGEK